MKPGECYLIAKTALNSRPPTEAEAKARQLRFSDHISALKLIRALSTSEPVSAPATRGERLLTLRWYLAALRDASHLAGGDGKPIALVDKEAHIARVKGALEQLRILREIEEARKQRGELGGAELQGSNPSFDVSGVRCHSRESGKPGGRIQVAESST